MNYLASFLAHEKYKNPLFLLNDSFSQKDFDGILEACYFENVYFVNNKNIDSKNEYVHKVDIDFLNSDKFDVVISAEYMVPENFNSAQALWDLIQKLEDEE